MKKSDLHENHATARGGQVGTRFICAEESAAGPKHRRAVLKAQSTDTTQTRPGPLVGSSRPR